MLARVVGFALVVACGQPAPVAPARPPTAAEILTKHKAVYATASTYTDRGHVRQGLATRSFDATFVRSSRFRFDLRNESDPQRGFVLWADDTHTFTRWYGPPRTTDDGTALGVAIAVTSDASLGAVELIGHLIDPARISGPELVGARVEGTETVDERPCWIVVGTRSEVPTRMWIDRETHLLRRLEAESVEMAFSPAVGAPIDLAAVPPPDFSDDYDASSVVFAAMRELVGTQAPAFDAAAVEGTARTTLAGLAGNVVVVDFWATWCGPCLLIMPRLNEWHRRLAGRGLRIVGLSSEDPDDIAAMVRAKRLDYVIARDEGAAIARTYNVSALPMLVVIDRTGVVRYVTLGAGDLDAVEAVLENLLR